MANESSPSPQVLHEARARAYEIETHALEIFTHYAGSKVYEAPQMKDDEIRLRMKSALRLAALAYEERQKWHHIAVPEDAAK